MGKVPIFSERAPFKLSQEFFDVLGGWNLNEGGLGVRFCKMLELAFACASTHADEIASVVEATVLLLDSNYRTARDAGNSVRSRLRMRGPPNSVKQKTFIMDMVNAALTSWGILSGSLPFKRLQSPMAADVIATVFMRTDVAARYSLLLARS
jgi:hypothetical protein